MYQISKRRSHKPASSGDSKVDKKVADKVNSTTGTADPVQVPVLVCKYHPGEVAPNKVPLKVPNQDEPDRPNILTHFLS